MDKPNTYSFSRLSSWNTCKHAWNNQYNLNDRGEDNWFSRFGTLAHDIFEKVDRKEIKPEDALPNWVLKYEPEVLQGNPHEFKWMDKWQSEAEAFFRGFKGWRTEPVWIEKHVVLERDGYNFQGYVDRLSRMPDGTLAMQDYKCSNVYEGEKLREKARQMYLYSAGVHQEFGEFPKKLIFYHFRKKAPVIIPFNGEAYEEAWEWADRTVNEIEAYEGNYPMQDNGFFCQAICNFRNTCTKEFTV
jgi:RecB family exonuclease